MARFNMALNSPWCFLVIASPTALSSRYRPASLRMRHAMRNCVRSQTAYQLNMRMFDRLASPAGVVFRPFPGAGHNDGNSMQRSAFTLGGNSDGVGRHPAVQPLPVTAS